MKDGARAIQHLPGCSSQVRQVMHGLIPHLLDALGAFPLASFQEAGVGGAVHSCLNCVTCLSAHGLVFSGCCRGLQAEPFTRMPGSRFQAVSFPDLSAAVAFSPVQGKR